MKLLLILFSTLTLSCAGSSQVCNKNSLIDVQIKNSLESDIYSFLDFEKSEIPSSKLFYSKELIPINLARFDITTEVENQKKSKNSDIGLNGINAIKNESNYIVFNTGLIDNYIMVEIFFKREEYFNHVSESEYETWRRQNAGISYLFKFNDGGCIVELKKHPISYD